MKHPINTDQSVLHNICAHVTVCINLIYKSSVPSWSVSWKKREAKTTVKLLPLVLLARPPASSKERAMKEGLDIAPPTWWNMEAGTHAGRYGNGQVVTDLLPAI